MKKDDRCPFLEEIVVRYCKAYPIQKMIPRSSLKREDPCIGCPEQCSVYQEVSGTACEKDIVQGFIFDSSANYLPNHFWIRYEKKNLAKIGFDDFATKLLRKTSQIILPNIEQGIGAIEIQIRFRNKKFFIIPVSRLGKIIRTNQAVVSNPAIIFDDPYGNGWLFSAENSKMQIENSKYGIEARKWFEQEINLLQDTVQKECGVTIADGGELVSDIREQVPEKSYRRLLKKFLNVEIRKMEE